MKRRKGARAAFVVTVAGGVLAAGCASEERIITNPPIDVPDASMDAGPDAAACPSAPPVYGSACTPPPGGECTWVGMPCPPYSPERTTARCAGGRWELSYLQCNPPPDVVEEPDVLPDVPPDADAAVAPDADSSTVACPDSPPTVGDACTGSPIGRCYYSFPCPGSFPGSTIFECSEGRWRHVGTAKCNPPPDGGPSDGG